MNARVGPEHEPRARFDHLGKVVSEHFFTPSRVWRHRSAARRQRTDRKSTRLNSSHLGISYAVFCLKKKRSKSERQGTVTTTTAENDFISTSRNITSHVRNHRRYRYVIVDCVTRR